MTIVSLVQMNVQKGAPTINWRTAQAHVAEASRRGAQVVVFPELWDAGVAYDKAKDIASPLNGGLFAQVVALARQHNIYIIGSMFEKRGTGVYNTMAVIGPREGVLGAYRKIHLFPPMKEPQYILPGETPLSI
ncbi:MAG TPA: nitrilase-related carbon-nitrogen hydrolase, partial [Aggregatilineaceae bacterium]|nr:nitrilase-related carbon-nitrogen hydrolase [Aggregatilineaceae bacterium]